MKSVSHVQLFATLWTATYQAPLSVGFSRQGHWSGLPFPSLEDLPNPGIKPGSPTLQADILPSEPPGKPLSTVTSTQFKMVVAGHEQTLDAGHSDLKPEQHSCA